MDQGIIRFMKANYMLTMVLLNMLRAVESGRDIPNISILQVMVMIDNTWNVETILNGYFYFFISHILRTSTEHITAPLADEGNYAYCQSTGAHNNT